MQDNHLPKNTPEERGAGPTPDAPEDRGSTPSPGRILEAAREKRGWSLEHAAREMNLDPAVLAALEHDDDKPLSAAVYVKGHLRKYAELLGIDAVQVMDAYYDRYGRGVPQPTVVPDPQPEGDATAVPARWIAVGVLVAGFLAYVIFGRGGDEPDGPVLEPDAAPVVESPAPDSEPPAAETPPSAPEIAVEVAGEPEPEPAEAADPAPEEVDETPAPEPSRPRRQPEPEPEPMRVVEATPDPAPSPSTSPVAGSAVAPVFSLGPEHDLVFSFEVDSWVEVTDGSGARVLYELGRAGRDRSVSGPAPFRVFLGYRDGVSVTLDGEPWPVPDSPGNRDTVRFAIDPPDRPN